MTRKAVLERFTAGLAVVAVVCSSLLIGTTADAQSPQPDPSGPITFEPAAGTNDTILTGTTAGPCSVPGADASNAVVSGPGVFAPNEATGRVDGITFGSTTTIGFSTTEPISFFNRISFKDLAQEAGGTLLPGEYVVTFRCVELVFQLEIFQSYRSTIVFTDSDGDGVADTYTTSNPPAPTPTPGAPTPTPGAETPTPTPGPGTPTPTPGPGTPTPTPDVETPTPTPDVETPTPTPDVETPTPTPGVETPTPTPVVTPTPIVTPSPPSAPARRTSTELFVVPRRAFEGDLIILLARVSPFRAPGTVQFKEGRNDIGGPQGTFFGFALQFAQFDEGRYRLTAEFTPRNLDRFRPSSSDNVRLRVRD